MKEWSVVMSKLCNNKYQEIKPCASKREFVMTGFTDSLGMGRLRSDMRIA